jgi:hypothetical protein
MIRMATTPQTGALVPCDSCGAPAPPEHIHVRLARLELASRYRPIHIGLLLICTAPPEAMDDDLYAWERQNAGVEARKYIEGLFLSVGIGTERTPAERLAEFQRRGIYLARLVECPLPSDAHNENILRMATGTMVKRITQSYKPARIGLLAPVPTGLCETLRAAGLEEKLIAGGQGIEVPSPGDEAGMGRVRKILDTAMPSANTD